VAGEAFSSPSYHLDWFDIEVSPQMGIDVYRNESFPIEKGFEIYSGKERLRRTEILIFREAYSKFSLKKYSPTAAR
jgi:hypothetical protein